MRKCFFLLVCIVLAIVGCQEGPQGDPAFKKEKADPASKMPVKGQRQQEAPPA